ncbi:anti-sigma factor family protein [Streptomyces sp. NPDC001691]|uniref:anti-sigma factor family protein n=1 Tax=unclassified Streptomyces TaxID=2593676 RepID=UPI000DE998F5|nr:zf-HC2 domain-containing protein [Streptomyces sp. SDr-06]RCH68339.1 RNA polymerase subunit sigma [Streptomyces sp. SDr-06]
MTTGDHAEDSPHEAVGAYALGILDDAEATAFEEHLAGCELCAAELDGLAGMAPMLATLKEFPGPAAQPLRPAPPGMTTTLINEVAAQRARRRRRTTYLVAAAAALIIGGPAVAVVATSGDTGTQQSAEAHPTSPAEDAFFNHMTRKVSATDPKTQVTATVGTEAKAWGTHTVLELKNVKGPLKCSLIAVGKNGERETVTSWAVPNWGYGLPDSPHETARYPLYVHGGTGLDRAQIDHFEVRTSDGKALVDVPA